MGKIIRNGINYGGTYEDATSVNYDGTASGLEARTVQEAVDELSDSLSIKTFNCENNIRANNQPIQIFKIGNIAIISCSIQLSKDIEWGTVAISQLPQEINISGDSSYIGSMTDGIVQIYNGQIILKPNNKIEAGEWISIILIYPIR